MPVSHLKNLYNYLLFNHFKECLAIFSIPQHQLLCLSFAINIYNNAITFFFVIVFNNVHHIWT